MHLPAYSLIKQCLRESDDPTVVSIPLDVFKRLVRLAAHANDFDEVWYTAAYDDVAKALSTGAIESALAHYGDGGYFEGRRAKVLDVDEDWYLERYPDVAIGIAEGKIASGHAHFNLTGYSEGRVPSPDMERDIEEWNRLIERHRDASTSKTPDSKSILSKRSKTL